VSKVNIRGGVEDLIADFAKIRTGAPRALNGVVRDGVRAGTTSAKGFAKTSAGRHGKRYPAAITGQMRRAYLYGEGAIYHGEYGPDISRPQGGMSFEYGSRNQKPHMDLNRSADLVGPQFAREVGNAIDRLFWNGGGPRGGTTDSATSLFADGVGQAFFE